MADFDRTKALEFIAALRATACATWVARPIAPDATTWSVFPIVNKEK